MRIPRFINIKKSRWKITIDATKLDTVKYNGLCYHDSKEIFIDPNLSRNEVEETFIHELLHAIWPAGMCSYTKEEQLVSRLANALQPVVNKLCQVNKRSYATSKKKKTNSRHR